ncbi:MAG TPA: tripartite tricarboxylate transporter substrate-binding protein [Methylomirabilota bacterium]|nr:tripartite tricarboxylate transporter substrate-binding protein [Methylomirabilota bacterium]
MSDVLGQQVVIDNRTGGNSVVAANAVLQAPRDGYTFLVDAANQLTNPFLIKDLPFDYPSTWMPVSQLSSFPKVIAVRHDFPARTIQEFIALAREQPGEFSYGTPPAAGMAHMAGEELQRRAGIKLVHAPYRGGFDAARDIGSGSLDAVLITTSSIRLPLQNGKARILAVTNPRRTASFPDVPTLVESGFPGFDMNDWTGLFAAAGTPEPSIARLYEAVAKASKTPAVRERLDPIGAEPVASTPQEFGVWPAGQRALLGKLLVEAGIKLGWRAAASPAPR